METPELQALSMQAAGQIERIRNFFKRNITTIPMCIILTLTVKLRTWGGKGRGQGGRVGNADWSSESTEVIAEQLSPHQSQNSLLKNPVPYYYY